MASVQVSQGNQGTLDTGKFIRRSAKARSWFGVLIHPTLVLYPEDRVCGANGSLLSLQPADLLAPLSDRTLLTLCRLGRLLRNVDKKDRSLGRPV